MYNLIIYMILLTILVILLLGYVIYKGCKDLKELIEIKNASKCPYYIDKEDDMAQNYKKITISVPKELDKVMNALVEESKKTANPINKSKLMVVATYEYLHNANSILQAKNEKEEKK